MKNAEKQSITCEQYEAMENENRNLKQCLDEMRSCYAAMDTMLCEETLKNHQFEKKLSECSSELELQKRRYESRIDTLKAEINGIISISECEQRMITFYADKLLESTENADLLTQKVAALSSQVDELSEENHSQKSIINNLTTNLNLLQSTNAQLMSEAFKLCQAYHETRNVDEEIAKLKAVNATLMSELVKSPVYQTEFQKLKEENACLRNALERVKCELTKIR